MLYYCFDLTIFYRSICLYTFHVIVVDNTCLSRNISFLKDFHFMGEIYGRVWMEERDGRNVTIKL